MSFTVIFQLSFSFIYSIFNKKFSVLSDVWYGLKSQFIFLLFKGLIILFGIIYGSKCTNLINFYLYLPFVQ